MTTWRVVTATNVGLVREANEDSVLVTDTAVIVADGMGGHAAGEVASSIAVQAFADSLPSSPAIGDLEPALVAANDAILADAAATPSRYGMGTTLVSLVLVETSTGRMPAWINIGDSRLYRLRDGSLTQLSKDHSVAEEWVRQGRLTPEEAAEHPKRHQLTRVLGMPEAVEGDVAWIDVRTGDRVLLCSDGLSNEVSDAELADVASGEDLQAAADALIERALHHGGRDNVTLALVEITSVSGTQTDAPAVTRAAAPIVPVAPERRTSARRRRARSITWRQGAFFGGLAALLLGVVLVLQWYAGSSYFLADDHGHIAVYQGQSNGFLWFQPHEVLVTNFKTSELHAGDLAAVRNKLVEPSLDAALRHASNLHDAWVLTNHVGG